MATDQGVSLDEIMENEDLQKKIDINKYVGGTVGIPTLKDILNELAKPGRDPRKKAKVFEFAEGIYKMEDLSYCLIIFIVSLFSFWEIIKFLFGYIRFCFLPQIS